MQKSSFEYGACSAFQKTLFLPYLKQKGVTTRFLTLQSFDMQGFIVPHLKDLIHICLEPEDQDPSRTLKITYVLSINHYFTS